MQFDSSTTLIAACCIIAVLGAQMLFFWWRDRRAPWLAWYAATFLVGTGALLIYLLPSEGHEFMNFGPGNSLRILPFVFVWHGARTFARRKPEQLVGVLAVAIWLALCSVPSFLASLEWRVMAASVYIVVFCGLAAYELWRLRGEHLPSLYPAMLTYVSYATLGAVRIFIVDMVPFPVGARPMEAGWVAASAFVTFIHAVFLTALTISMTREREELEQRRFALSDPLTGLLNRRAFLDQVGEPRRRPTGAQPITLLVLDLDHFKLINDRYGHEAGDRMLRHFAEIAGAAIRPGDLLFRMGGEEFCAVLHNTRVPQARQIAERLRRAYAERPIQVDGETIFGTVSIGIAAEEQAGTDLDLLLAAADAALYAAKARGRNQTAVAEALDRPPGDLSRAVA
ncbi:MAG TPA: GGDEF domain-containing protein [Devosia sp.]|nr:GGDEF domain-containing protein [Devosia sp.]